MIKAISRILMLTLLPFATGSSVRAESANPHTLNPETVCSDCHVTAPESKTDLNTINHLPAADGFSKDGIAMCTDCHSAQESHVVGASLDFSVPADLPLAADGTISCLSCHYTHGSLKTDTPRASYSFMDRMLNDPRMTKSFLIRRSNVNGELCLVCHQPSR